MLLCFAVIFFRVVQGIVTVSCPSRYACAEKGRFCTGLSTITGLSAGFQFFLPYCVRCRKLPKALKDWPAFKELGQKIDDFNEMVPLLELMANKAMKKRHWKRMEDVTGTPFDVDSDNFTLRNLLEAPLLKYKEEIEVSQSHSFSEDVRGTLLDFLPKCLRLKFL